MATPLNGSIVNGFAILSLFGDHRSEIDPAFVSKRLGMNNATAHRNLATLEHTGALRRIRRGVFALGPELERLGRLADRHNPVAKIIEPDLQALSGKLNESVMACRLSRHGPTCIAVANSNRPISVNIEVGTLLPFQRSAQGKLWLAHMNAEERAKQLSSLEVSDATTTDLAELDGELLQIRKQGFAINLGDNEPDIAAISIPVYDGDEELALTISVFGMLSRFDESFIGKAKSELIATAGQIDPELF